MIPSEYPLRDIYTLKNYIKLPLWKLKQEMMLSDETLIRKKEGKLREIHNSGFREYLAMLYCSFRAITDEQIKTSR